MDTTEAKVEVTSRNYGPFAVEFDEGEPEVTKTGYTLTDGNHWVNADGAAMSPENVYENAEFFANWRQNAYTVSYNSNKPTNASKEIAGTTADSSHLFDRDGETLSQNGYTLQGWTFNGWNTSPDGSGNKFDGSTGNYADMEQVKNLTTEDAKMLELFAQWNANTYHIAYNSNKPANASSLINGTMDDSILTYDTAANLSNLGYSLPGYTWTGWNDMADASGNAYSDGQEVLNLSDTQDAVVTMFAQWKPNTYTVLFDHTSSPVNGDITGDTSKTVTFDDVYGTLPTLNEKTGYTAQGWYTARTDGEKVTETTKVTNPSNHTLFARWTPNSYNISFDVNMGSQANKVAANASVNPGAMSVTYDATYGTLPIPVWSGWTFKGWNLAPNGTGITRNGSDKVQITSDETVYAQWVDDTAPTFTMNATTGAIASSGTISFANVVEQGSGIAGYYIGQTQPNASGSNVTFGGTTSVTVNNSGTWYMAIKDKAGNMSAVQSIVYYSLTLNADGATNYTTNSAFIKAGTVITLPTGLTKTGYKADTWTGGISSITMNQNGSLFPSWKIQSYILSFNANGGNCSEGNRLLNYNAVYGTLPIPSLTGYTFAGWFTSAIGGTQVFDTTKMGTSNVIIYAHWTVNTYTLYFNANGGSCAESSRLVQYGAAYGALPTPSASGYKFLGWFTEASGGNQVYNTSVMAASDCVIYAHWELIDNTPPSLSYTSSVAGVVYQGNGYGSFTYTFSDSESGIYGYYWGTTYPSATNVTYTPYSGTSITLNNTGGTYYFAVKDNNGNINIAVSKCKKGSFGSSTTRITTAGYRLFTSSANNWGWYGITLSDGKQIQGKANASCSFECTMYSYVDAWSDEGMNYVMVN